MPKSGEIVDKGRWKVFWKQAQLYSLFLGAKLKKEGFDDMDGPRKDPKTKEQDEDREVVYRTVSGDEEYARVNSDEMVAFLKSVFDI